MLREVVNPHFDGLRAEEREQTGQEWGTLRVRELLFQKVSVAIARGNTMILNTLRHSWTRAELREAEAACYDQSLPGFPRVEQMPWGEPSVLLRGFEAGGM